MTKPESLNLRHLSHGSDRVTTTINLIDIGERHAWITLGEVSLTKSESQPYWLLESLLLNASDPSHDAALILRLPLVGVTLHMIAWGSTWIHGWINGARPRDFRVPAISYNPLTMRDTVKCKQCKGDAHLIVPEGCYVPPVNEALFDQVRGCELQIIIAPVRKEP